MYINNKAVAKDAECIEGGFILTYLCCAPLALNGEYSNRIE